MLDIRTRACFEAEDLGLYEVKQMVAVFPKEIQQRMLLGESY